MSLRPLLNLSIAVTTALYAVLFLIAFFGGLFGIVLLWFLGLSLWRYGYAVLLTVARGRSDIPPPSIESMNFFNQMGLIAHLLVFVAMILFIGRFMPWGTQSIPQLLALVLLLGIVGAFPASAAVMALTSNLFAAVNPQSIASLVKALGRDYFVLIGACVVLTALSALGEYVMASQLGLASALPVVALGIWTLLAIFALTGSAIHAHRDDIEIPGMMMTREEKEAIARQKEWRATLDAAYGSIRGGLLAEGYQTLKRFVAEHGGGVDVQYWLFENMLEWEDKQHALRIAARLTEHLVREASLARAFELYLRCRRLPGDLILDAQTAAKLAAYAEGIGQVGVAGELNARIAGQPSMRS